ncbi:MAG TPA: AGE family epimerase/isomerase, partial [Rhodothermales bacterium]|nr:AGE family epimerase/isomerase [Rhodothermales bacterium]
LAWLLLHASDRLGLLEGDALAVVEPIFEHCVEYGIDWEEGGVFVDGPMNGRPEAFEKQFWQQAEVLVGLLDAYRLTHKPVYWAAFRNVFEFVFRKLVVPHVGEWYERVDRSGTPIDTALGHAWKISYHTVRSMVQTVDRLDRLLEAPTG